MCKGLFVFFIDDMPNQDRKSAAYKKDARDHLLCGDPIDSQR